jgi:uncharacterized protein YjbI with pentapeptide repeats
MDQERKPQQQVTSERRSSDLLWILAAIIAVFLLELVANGYVQGRWQWKGYGFGQKSLWDWLDLLIVPLALGIGGLWFQRMQRRQELRRQEHQQERALYAEDQRSQDTALQTYLEYMGQLLLDKDKPLRLAEGSDDVRTLAQARTLTVLGRVNATRKRDVLNFLYNANLISEHDSDERTSIVIPLSSADLRKLDLRKLGMSGANLAGADLRGADFSDTVFRRMKQGNADMREAHLRNTFLAHANLRGTDLRGADMRNVDLIGADLSDAKLQDIDLREADLRGATLYNADLSGANLADARLVGVELRKANLHGADLRRASLDGATLSGANLLNAKVRQEQLARAGSLEGATMPGGSKQL